MRPTKGCYVVAPVHWAVASTEKKGGIPVTAAAVSFQNKHSPYKQREMRSQKLRSMSAEDLLQKPVGDALDLEEAFMFNPDMKEINSSLGQQGPSSTYPIPWDNVPISDLRRPKDGSLCLPHSSVLPKKYCAMLNKHISNGGSLGGKLEIHESGVGKITYQWRTPAMRKAQHELFSTPGNKIAPGDSRIMNQVKVPLLQVPHVMMMSPLPLHLTLGLVTDEYTKIVETLRDLEQPSEEKKKLLDEADEHHLFVELLHKDIEHFQQAITDIEDRLVWLNKAYPQALIKVDKKYALQSDEARLVQQCVQECIKKLAATKTQKKKHDKEFKKAEEKAKEVRAEADKVRGKMELQFNKILYDAGVRGPCVWSSSYVGNDCHKLLELKLRREVCALLLDRVNVLPQKRDEALTLRALYWISLKKLWQCYTLYSRGVYLTDKDLTILQLRCWSRGCWRPTHFPKRNITPKEHILYFITPCYAVAHRTVGGHGEHGAEACHRVVNSIKRKTACKYPNQTLRSISRVLQVKQHVSTA